MSVKNRLAVFHFAVGLSVSAVVSVDWFRPKAGLSLIRGFFNYLSLRFARRTKKWTVCVTDGTDRWKTGELADPCSCVMKRNRYTCRGRHWHIRY